MTSIVSRRTLERCGVTPALISSLRSEGSAVAVAVMPAECDQCHAVHLTQHAADNCCTYD